MSLARTPPKEGSGSAPDLSNVHFECGKNLTPNVRLEKRRRGDVMEDDLKTFMEEMRMMLSSATKAQNSKLTSLQSSIEEIKQQNNDISKCMEFLSLKYEETRCKLEVCEQENKRQLEYIRTLENKVEHLESTARNSSIEIRNVPNKIQENKEDLVCMVKHIGTAMGVNIVDNDIKDVFRYNAKSQSKKPIVVEFTTVLKKESMLKGVKNYKYEKKSSITTALANVTGPAEPLYISESLTAQTKKIYAMARKFASENSFKFCWTSHGYVYLRRAEGSKAVRVCGEEDLKRISATK